MLKPPHYELFQTSQMPSFGNLKSVLNLTKFNSIPKCSQISQTLRHFSSPNARPYHSTNPRHRKESKVWTGFDPVTNELVTRRITNNGEDLGLGDENPSSEKPIVKKPVWSGYNSISRSEGGVGPPLRRTGKVKLNWVCQECGASDGQWWGTCPSCKVTGSLKQFVDSERVAGSNKTRGLWLPRCPAEMRPRRLPEVNKGINKLEWRIPL